MNFPNFPRWPRAPRGPRIPNTPTSRPVPPIIPSIPFPPVEPLKQPLLLFPLRLEMRKMNIQNRTQYYLRWYPDEISLKISEQKISEEELALLEELLRGYNALKIVQKNGALLTENYPLINENILKKHNQLTPQNHDDLSKEVQGECNAYNAEALEIINEKYKGDKLQGWKREGFGIYDFENPYLNNLWQPLLQTLGEARVTYLANQYHQNPHLATSGSASTRENQLQSTLEEVFNQGVEVCFLPQNLSLYALQFTSSHPQDTFDSKENIQLDLLQTVTVKTPLFIQLNYEKLEDRLKSEWFYNFDLAVKRGMGLIIKDPNTVQKIDSADWLLVTGHQHQSNDELKALFESHLSHSKLSFSSQDAPTNNTAKKTSSFRDEEKNLMRKARLQFDSGYHEEYDSQKLSKFLGLPSSFFSNVLNADLKEQLDASNMAEMMWELVTFLPKESQSFGGDPAAWTKLKSFYINHVRARGHFPTLNFDDIPYGILPIMDTHQSKFVGSDAAFLEEVKSINLKLLEQQKNEFSDTPKINHGDPSPYSTFLQVMQQTAVSSSMRAKKCSDFQPKEDAYPIKGPLAQDLQWNTKIGEPSFTGLEFLSCASRGSLKKLNPNELKVLTRLVLGSEATGEDLNSYLREIEGQVSRVTHKDASGTTHYLLSPVDIAFLDRHIKGNRTKPKVSLLHKLISYFVYRSHMRNVQANLQLIRSQAEYLSKLTRSKLEILMMECSDLLSFRVDAWISALAFHKLKKLSEKHFYKPGFGCYGWLEKPGEVQPTPNFTEYLQAPSNEQSITAALLRSGYHSQNAGLKSNETFNINLNSKRVRKAKNYLEALRQGHHPSEILGYELEKMLKEKKVNQDIVFNLRERFSFSNHEDLPVVIDGEKVIAENQDSFPEEVKAAVSELKQIKDSLSDLVLSEALYQVIRGNHERLGAWLNVLSGDATAPELEFIQNPRNGEYRDIKVYLPIYQREERENFTDLLDPCLKQLSESVLSSSNFFEYTVKVNFYEIEFLVSLNIQDELNFNAYDLLLHDLSNINLLIKWLILSLVHIEDPRFQPLFTDERFDLAHFKSIWQELNIELSLDPIVEKKIKDLKSLLYQGDKSILNPHLIQTSSYKPSLIENNIDLEDGYAQMLQRFEELKELTELDEAIQTDSIDDIVSSRENLLTLSQYNLLTPVTDQLLDGSSTGINAILDARLTQRLQTIQNEAVSNQAPIESKIKRLAQDFCLLMGKKRTSFIFMASASDPLPSRGSQDQSLARLLAYSQVHSRLAHALETLTEVQSVRKIVKNQDQVTAEEYYLISENLGRDPVAYIEIDRWQDFIPKLNTRDQKMKQTTPITVRYPTPRSQAPNAILIATPPETDDFYLWDDKKVSHCLAQTLQLMQARMGSSRSFSDHNSLGLFLPLLYSFNPYGKGYYEPYKSAFLSLSSQPGDFTFIDDPAEKELAENLASNNAFRQGEDL